MQRLAVYGKGGIGKSTIAANISMQAAMAGEKVLHVGCDPKHDSTLALIDGRRPVTIAELLIANRDLVSSVDSFLVPGRMGIDLVESGGPEPGIGCAGRGIARMFDIFEDLDIFHGGYTLAIFDVLGDVVCGGFAAPMRQGYADQVLIVISEEIMSLYAANNIARAVRRFKRNGVRLAGLILNRRDNDSSIAMAQAFAKTIRTPILHTIARDPLIGEAEQKKMTVSEYAPESESSAAFRQLSASLLEPDRDRQIVPEPLEDEAFSDFVSSFDKDGS